MRLEVELAPRHKSGLLLRNPVIMAAGPFGYGVEYAKSAEIHRLGALVCSGVTRRPHAGAAQPLILETASGLLSAFDRPSPGAQKVLKTYAENWAAWHTPVIVNLAGTSIDDFADLAARLDNEPGVAALELNLACPDLAGSGLPFGVDPVLVTRLVSAVRQASALPILAKLAPYDGDLRPIALAAASAGVDAISLVQAIPGLSIDLRARRPALFGGLSGPAIKPLALRLVYEIARELHASYPHVPVIGIGGIASAHDALEFLLVGASAVQIGSAVFANPRIGVEIVEGIEAFLHAEGVKEIGEIIGAAWQE